MNAKGEGESAAPDEDRERGFGAPSAPEEFRFKETLTHLGLRQLESKLRAAGDEVLLQQVEEEKERRQFRSHAVEEIAKQVASLSYEALRALQERGDLAPSRGPTQKTVSEVIWAELSSREAPPDPLRDGSSHFDAVETFDLARVRNVVLGAAEVAGGHRPPLGLEPPREGAPMRLLTAFPALRLREGFVLRAWLWGDLMDGFGEVWALPAETELGAPPDKIRGEPPWPVDALDDFMEAVEGDGSAWSYLCASLFAREAAELGRAGHTCNWSTHILLDADPLEALPRRGSPSPDPGDELAGRRLEQAQRERSRGGPSGWYEDWEWWDFLPERQRPTEWAPTVSKSEEGVVVRFYTRTSMWRETIWRNTDIYRLGSYRPRMFLEELATGPPGPMV